MDEIGDEERQFVNTYIATGNMELAARGTIVEPDASPAFAKKTALQALGDTNTKAYFIQLMEEAQLTPLDVMETLKRNLTTKRMGIMQGPGGGVVELGDDGLTQLTAAKLIMQATGLLGGGPKAEPTDRNPAPAQINIVFPGRNIRTPKEDVIIDGNNSYSASED